MVEKEVFDEAQRVMKENSPQKTNPAVTASRILSIPSLQNFQRRLREGRYQNPGLARKYLKLFVEKIEVDGRKVTIIARQDILQRAVSADSGDSFDLVPTPEVQWLPRQDDFRNFCLSEEMGVRLRECALIAA